MRKNFKKVFIVILIVLIINMILVINMKNVRAADSKDKIHFLKLGNTDSILIESNGHYGLIDTSNPSTDNTEEKDSRNHKDFNNDTYNGKTVVSYLNKLGVQSLDFVMGTHSHSDHIGGIPDICNSGNFVNSNTTYIYKKYVKIDEEEGGTYEWYNGDYFSLATSYMQSKNSKLLDVTNHSSSNLSKINARFVDNSEDVTDYIEFTFQNYNIKIFNLYVASYTNENTNSLVTLITKGNQKMLFMGDMNVVNSTEQKIAKYIGDVDLIKIGHHGYSGHSEVVNKDGSTSLGLLKLTRPEIAILTREKPLTETFTIAKTWFKENGGKIYKTSDGNSATVAVVDTNNINIYTYDNSGSLTKTQSVISESEGAKVGWVKGFDDSDEEIWAYINTDGTFLKKWAQLTYEGKTSWYYFRPDGVMKIGWHDDDDGLRYFLNNKKNASYYVGEILKGWQCLGYEGKEYWFYFAQSATEIDGFKEGSMVTGWQTLSFNGTQGLFYFKESPDDNYCKGARVTGWQVIDGKAYYFNTNGLMEKVDDQGPNIEVTGNATDWTKENVTLTINATDDGIGLAEEPYSFDGGNSWTADNTMSFNENGTVNILVKDKMENKNFMQIQITKIMKLESISIESEPYKTSYYVGDSLEIKGLRLMAVYDVGETEVITSGYGYNIIKLMNPGTQIIEVTYEGKQTSFEVEVLEVPKEITLESSAYEIQNNKIAKIQPNSNVKAFKKNITTNSEEIKIYNSQNVECGDNDSIKTGMKLKLEDNSTYTLIVTGDVNGDAKSDSTDMDLINKHRLNEESLAGEYLLAGDVNSDGKVDVKDLMKINKYRLQKIDSL